MLPLAITHDAPGHVVPGVAPVYDFVRPVERLEIEIIGEPHALVETRRVRVMCAPEVVQGQQPLLGLANESEYAQLAPWNEGQ